MTSIRRELEILLNQAEQEAGGRAERRYCFADFSLDPIGGHLTRAGEQLELRPKALEVLTYLVERQGRAVTREELMLAVWPNVAVTDESVTRCIADIRKVLMDDEQRLIRTLPRLGYIFAAPVTTPVIEFPRVQELQRVDQKSLPPSRSSRFYLVLAAATAVGLMSVPWSLNRAPIHTGDYIQITNFADSAVSPALSPDGRMLAFIRSGSWWLSSGQIHVKLLPNGDPVEVTRDPRPKYGLAFSPDGSRVAYTVQTSTDWSTYTVSSLGGEPAKVLSNAAGLTWLDQDHVLFSEIKTGIHMGVVTARENRSQYRQIYFPQDERGMAHLSYASPDRKWALVVEMNPVWQPCRVIPLDGSSAGRQAGPKGRCTSAAWSPDGKWMYLGVDVDGQHHLWRQAFPAGQPERITSGPTEEEGIAVAPDGLSLVTSIGILQGQVWIHDAHGDRQLSLEGHVPSGLESGRYAAVPIFSRDGKSLYYLRRESPGAPFKLWRGDLESGKSAKVLPGFSILEYDVSNRGDEVVFSTQASGQALEIWLARLDFSGPPRLIFSGDGDSPHFGPDGEILFRLPEGNKHYLARMNRDGSGRSKVAPYEIGNVQYISPDRRWITTISPLPDGRAGTIAVPTGGGDPRIICMFCGGPAIWAPDGKFLYIPQAPGMVAIPVPAGETLPNLPPSGITGLDVLAAFPGSRVIDGYLSSPGPDPSIYAYVKTTVHRNLFRVPLPR